jgi:DNA-binding MurR/RpiR family transcriptional regulator
VTTSEPARPPSTSKLPPELLRDLRPKRRELIRPVLDHPRDYVLLSVRRLADAIGADPMAVLRAIRDMGFDGYASFREYLHELALVQATQLDTMASRLAPGSDIPAHLHASLARLEQLARPPHARLRPSKPSPRGYKARRS